MNDVLFLVPLSLALGVIGLLAFIWCLRSSQYDDLDGAAERILFDEDRPLSEPPESDGEPRRNNTDTDSDLV